MRPMVKKSGVQAIRPTALTPTLFEYMCLIKNYIGVCIYSICACNFMLRQIHHRL